MGKALPNAPNPLLLRTCWSQKVEPERHRRISCPEPVVDGHVDHGARAPANADGSGEASWGNANKVEDSPDPHELASARVHRGPRALRDAGVDVWDGLAEGRKIGGLPSHDHLHRGLRALWQVGDDDKNLRMAPGRRRDGDAVDLDNATGTRSIAKGCSDDEDAKQASGDVLTIRRDVEDDRWDAAARYS